MRSRAVGGDELNHAREYQRSPSLSLQARLNRGHFNGEDISHVSLLVLWRVRTQPLVGCQTPKIQRHSILPSPHLHGAPSGCHRCRIHHHDNFLPASDTPGVAGETLESLSSSSPASAQTPPATENFLPPRAAPSVSDSSADGVLPRVEPKPPSS